MQKEIMIVIQILALTGLAFVLILIKMKQMGISYQKLKENIIKQLKMK